VFVTYVPHRPQISLRPNYTVTPGTFAKIVVVQQAMRCLFGSTDEGLLKQLTKRPDFNCKPQAKRLAKLYIQSMRLLKRTSGCQNRTRNTNA
jgi:hypothetical protein